MSNQNDPSTPSISNSVQQAIGKLGISKSITAWEIVKELLVIHPEYGDNLGERVSRDGGPIGGIYQTASEWLWRVYQLYEPSKVQKLHGRIVILGLSILDPVLNDYLIQKNLIENLKKEISEGFDSLLLVNSDRNAQSSGSRSNQTSQVDAEEKAISFKEFEKFPLWAAVKKIIEQAGQKAATAPGPIQVTTSFLLFALSEQGDSRHDPAWAADWLRQGLEASGNYSRVRDSYFSRKNTLNPSISGGPSNAISQTMTSNFKAILENAQRIALTTGSELIHARHVVAALLVDYPDPTQPGAQKRLTEMSLSPQLLREAFFDYLKAYGEPELEAWDTILLGEAKLSWQLPSFSTDNVRGTDTDLIGIDAEVKAFATLIAARSTLPPLAIGLFGEWGSGKTFFMRQLRKTVAGYARRARDSKPNAEG